jgi:hypothetical protein
MDEAVAPSRWRRLAALTALTALAGFLVGGQAALPARAAGADPVANQAVIGPEHPVAPTVINGPGGAQYPDVAFDGTNYLVVWDAFGSVRAARISRTGVLLDPQPMLIATGTLATVAFDGTNFLVVWSSSGYGVPGDIHGARVSTGGAVLDPEGFPIATGPDRDLFPAVAFDGTNYLVLWTSFPFELPFPATVHGTRVDTGGHVIDPSPVLIPEATGTPSVAFDGANFLVAFMSGDQGRDGIKAVRMSPDGAVVGPGAIQISAPTTANYPAVVFDGVHWQVAWTQWTPDGYDVHGARVSRRGSVLDPADILIATGPGDQGGVSMARNGTNVLVAWSDSQQDGDVFATRISRPGVVLDPAGIAIATGPGPQSSPALATGTNNILAIFVDDLGNSCCVAQGVRVSRAGAVLDPTPHVVSQQANSQFGPRIAFDGTNYLVAWEDDRTNRSERDIYAARVTPEGISLDPAGFFVGHAGTGIGLTDVAFNGTNFIVAWNDHPTQDRTDVHVALVSPDGVLLTPTPISLTESSGGGDGARLSPAGADTLVVWRDQTGLVAARLSGSGEILDPGVIPVTPPGEVPSGSFSVAFDGTNHLIVYGRFDPSHGGDVFARRVSAGGVVLDPTALPIAVTLTDEGFPEVAWSGRCYLVVWMSQTFDPSRRWVEAARVDTDGRVLAPGTVAFPVDELDQDTPRVASLNGWFLITWTTSRRLVFEWQITGARMHENGSILDPSGFLLADPGFFGDVAAGADGRWGTTYSGLAGPPTGVDRVFLRTVAPK